MKIRTFITMWTCAFMCFLSSCQSYLSEEQMKEYIKDPDNGLMHEKQYGDVKLQAFFKPTALVIAQDKSADSAQVEAYKKHYYFILNLSKKGQEVEASYVGNKDLFESQVKKMVFGMNRSVRIVADRKDTIPLKDYMYPRMFGGTGNSSFILAFENGQLKQANSFELIFDYPELGIVGEKFRFTKDDLEDVPGLINH